MIFYNFQDSYIETMDFGSLVNIRTLSTIKLFQVPNLITSLGVKLVPFSINVNVVGSGLTEIDDERRLFLFSVENVFNSTLGINKNITIRNSVSVIANNPFPIFFKDESNIEFADIAYLRFIFINQQQNNIVNIGTFNVTLYGNYFNVDLVSKDEGIFVSNKTNEVKARIRDANIVELISNNDVVRTFFVDDLSYLDFDITRNIFYLSERFTFHALKIFQTKNSYRPDEISERIFVYEDYFNITGGIRAPQVLPDKSVYLQPLNPDGIIEDYSIVILRPDPDIFEKPTSKFWIALIISLSLFALTFCIILTYNLIQLSRFVRVEIPSEPQY